MGFFKKEKSLESMSEAEKKVYLARHPEIKHSELQAESSMPDAPKPQEDTNPYSFEKVAQMPEAIIVGRTLLLQELTLVELKETNRLLALIEKAANS